MSAGGLFSSPRPTIRLHCVGRKLQENVGKAQIRVTVRLVQPSGSERYAAVVVSPFDGVSFIFWAANGNSECQ